MMSAQPIEGEIVEQPRSTAMQAAAPAGSPMGTALAFLQAGGNVEQLNSMLDLQLRWEANEARKAFVDDMTEFKKNPPAILKDKHVEFNTAKGVTSYEHATIGEACDKIIAAAAAHGFSHRWVPSKGEHGQMVVTCVITHRLGHTEETRLEGPKDETGGKNAIQSIVSTNTYLQRHTLLMAFGFATKDQPDDDGRGAGNAVETITEAQEIQLSELLEATGSDKAKFLAWLKVGSLSAIPAKSFGTAMATIRQKERTK
jgi:hypothetical protein